MTFGSTFGRVFSPTFQPKSQAAASSWWLAGGIAAANCVAAYQPKGAASLASSFVNLANPGTYNCVEKGAVVWNVDDGWVFDGGSDFDGVSTGISISTNGDWSVVVRANTTASGRVKEGRLFSASSYYEIIPFNGNDSNNMNYENGGLYNGTAAPSVPFDSVMAIVADKAYKDGSKLGDIPSGTQYTDELYIGNRENLQRQYAGNIIALSVYDTDISSYMSALTTAMNAL